MTKKHRPLEREKENAEFAFDLTPDLTGGRASRQHRRTSSGGDREAARRSRTENPPAPDHREEPFF